MSGESTSTSSTGTYFRCRFDTSSPFFGTRAFNPFASSPVATKSIMLAHPARPSPGVFHVTNKYSTRTHSNWSPCPPNRPTFLVLPQVHLSFFISFVHPHRTALKVLVHPLFVQLATTLTLIPSPDTYTALQVLYTTPYPLHSTSWCFTLVIARNAATCRCNLAAPYDSCYMLLHAILVFGRSF